MDLYIYYRVRSANAAALAALVAAMQKTISHDYGIVCALKRRPEEKEGLQTWMEICPGVPDGFEARLEQAVAQAGLAALIEGPRHIERFVDVSSCA